MLLTPTKRPLQLTASAAKLEDLLNRSANSIQLDKTRYDRMVSAYQAVTKVIEDDEVFFQGIELDLYPQGSVKIETSVKPLESEDSEFDLDCVLHIYLNDEDYDPFQIYAELKRVLENHGRYKDMVEAKTRVIRLNYAGDFHMDIMPGCQERIGDKKRIKVPDRRFRTAVSSSPRGFADWFLQRVESVEEFLFEKAFSAHAEPLPAQTPYQIKKPLVTAVQLIKRFRDIYFEDRPKDSPSSIILTTLAGRFYQGEGTIYETIDRIVQETKKLLEGNLNDIVILNPSNKEEDFSDKWKVKPTLFYSFIEFTDALHSYWQQINRQAGLSKNEKYLKAVLGENTFTKAFNEHQKFISETHTGSNKTFLGLRDITGLYNIASKSKPYCNGR